MNKINEKKKEDEIEKIWQAIMEAIPINVEMVNIIIALNRLAAEFTWELSENDDEIDEDYLLPGTSFSKN